MFARWQTISSERVVDVGGTITETRGGAATNGEWRSQHDALPPLPCPRGHCLTDSQFLTLPPSLSLSLVSMSRYESVPVAFIGSSATVCRLLMNSPNSFKFASLPRHDWCAITSSIPHPKP